MVGTIKLEEGQSANVGADFDFSDVLYSRGYIYNEPIKSYTWSSENMNVATVSGGQQGVIQAVGAGTTKVKVVIETVAGNKYTESVNVNVTAKPQPSE